MATKTIADAGGAWTSDATWVEGTKPTTSDNVVATATSGPVTIDSGAVCNDATFTGYTNVLTHTAGVNWAISGSLTMAAGMTYTLGSATTSLTTFNATATGKTFTSAGKTFGNVTFNGVGGGWTLGDALTSTGTITHTLGTVVSGNFNIQALIYAASGSSARTLTLGSSTLTLTSTGAGIFTVGTGLVVTAGTYTILLTGASPSFQGQAKTYNNVRFTGTGTATVQSANIFNDLTKTGGSLVLPAAVTTTATTFSLEGKPAATFKSSSAASAATLSVAAGTVRINHESIQDITATGGATFLAYDSVDVSGNTGITFVKAKSGALCGVG